MATKKKKKKKSSEPAEPPMPQPRSLSSEFGELLPLLGGLSQDTTRDYIASQKELTEYQYNFFKQHYPELAGMEREEQSKSTARVRSDALGWMGTYGPQATASYEAANPRLTEQLNKISELTANVGQRLPESPFTSQLDEMAQNELRLGGALTPEEERGAQQSARLAYAARGQAHSNPSAVAEVLNRDSASRARLRERQGIAAGREQAFEAREAQQLQKSQLDRSFTLSSAGLMESVNPVKSFLGMSGTNVQPQSLLGFTSTVNGVDTSGILGAGLQYGSDLYNTNLNMASSLYNSFQNNRAALQGAELQAAAELAAAGQTSGAYGSGGGFNVGGLLSGVGSGIAAGAGIAAAGAGATAAVGGGAAAAASAAIGVAFCWVAREVFGEHDKRWRIFRVWLALEASKSLRDFYREHGEGIAKWLRNRPHLKTSLRTLMEPLAV